MKLEPVIGQVLSRSEVLTNWFVEWERPPEYEFELALGLDEQEACRLFNLHSKNKFISD